MNEQLKRTGALFIALATLNVTAADVDQIRDTSGLGLSGWNDATTPTFFGPRDIWDDGNAPNGANDYFTDGHTLHTGPGDGLSVFAGNSLTIQNGDELVVNRGADGSASAAIILDGGSIVAGGLNDQTLTGSIQLTRNSEISLDQELLFAPVPRGLTFSDGTLTGSDRLTIQGDYLVTHLEDRFSLDNVDASGYTGQFRVNEATLLIQSNTSLSGENVVRLEDGILGVGGDQTLRGIRGTGFVGAIGAGDSILTTGGNGTPLDAQIGDGLDGGTLGINKVRGNTLTLTNPGNAFTGALTVSDGTLVIANSGAAGVPESISIKSGATFDTSAASLNVVGIPVHNDGAILGDVSVSGNGSYAGAGSVSGLLTIADATMSPGNSTATSTSNSLTWSGNVVYNWDLLNASGPAGAGAWDLLDVTTTFDLSAVTSATVNVFGIISESPDVSGIPANLDFSVVGNTTDFLFAQAASIIGFDANDFVINAGNLGHLGFFTIAQVGNNLVLTFTSTVPEPGTWIAFTTLLLAGGYALRRRRSNPAA